MLILPRKNKINNTITIFPYCINTTNSISFPADFLTTTTIFIPRATNKQQQQQLNVSQQQ